MLATTPDELSSRPRTYMMKGKRIDTYRLSCDIHMCSGMNTHHSKCSHIFLVTAYDLWVLISGRVLA